MFLHRGFQHLGRQVQKRLIDLAHQHDGPFDKTGNLGQKAFVFDHVQPLGESLIGGIGPDVFCPLGGVQHYESALQLCSIIVERRYRKCLARHEPVAFGDVASLDPVHI